MWSDTVTNALCIDFEEMNILRATEYRAEHLNAHNGNAADGVDLHFSLRINVRLLSDDGHVSDHHSVHCLFLSPPR